MTLTLEGKILNELAKEDLSIMDLSEKLNCSPDVIEFVMNKLDRAGLLLEVDE